MSLKCGISESEDEETTMFSRLRPEGGDPTGIADLLSVAVLEDASAPSKKEGKSSSIEEDSREKKDCPSLMRSSREGTGWLR